MANSPIPDDILDATYRASATAGGVYLSQHGIYTLVFRAAMFKQVPQVGRCFINELRVLESQRNPVTDEKGQAIDEDPHPPDFEFAYVVNYDGKGKLSADSNAKALVLATYGLEEGKVDGETFKRCYRDMVLDAQPVRGMTIRCTTYQKGIRGTRDPVTKEYTEGLLLPRWTSLGALGQGENAVEKVAARRVEIERGTAQQVSREDTAASGPPLPLALAQPVPTADPAARIAQMGYEVHPQNSDAQNPWYWNPATRDVKQRSQLLGG